MEQTPNLQDNQPIVSKPQTVKAFSVVSLVVFSLVASVIATGAFYLLKPEEVQVPEVTVRPTDSSTMSPSPLSTAGNFVKYTDEKLGFSFEYPTNVILIPYEDSSTGVQQQRQEKVIISMGGAQILVDPLGRIGADQGPASMEKEVLAINGVQWTHITIENMGYQRFTVAEKAIDLKTDPTTDIIDSYGQRSSSRREFRVHLYLEGVSDEDTKVKIEKVAIGILDSLYVLSGN